MAHDNNIIWHDPANEPFQLLGFPWYKEFPVYRRLPPKTGILPIPDAVDELANHTAGGQVRFMTDSRRIYIRAELCGPASMGHMAATGQCGFDCYTNAGGRMRFTGCAKYNVSETSYECLLFEQEEKKICEVVLNFPLYMGVKHAAVGLDCGAVINPPLPFKHTQRCIVYGTSIAQGGCASRPGLAYSNILSRRLSAEFINLGFSGSGRGEPVMAEIIASINNPGCYILDYEANVNYAILNETMPVFIEILRAKHPATPILVVSKTLYAALGYSEKAVREQRKNHELQRGIVETHRAAGDNNIHYTDGSLFFGDDFDECTVDGAHPNDIGFMRMADALAPIVSPLIDS